MGRIITYHEVGTDDNVTKIVDRMCLGNRVQSLRKILMNIVY